MPRTSRRCASTASTVPGYRDDPDTPRLRVVNLQVLVALVDDRRRRVRLRRRRRAHLASELGLDPALLALIIAPIATELPEKFNSVIWVRQGKDTLAMGNITGAMVFQSCIPTAIGIVAGGQRVDHLAGQRCSASPRPGIAFAVDGGDLHAHGSARHADRRHLLDRRRFYVVYLALVAHASGRDVVSRSVQSMRPDCEAPCQTYTRGHADPEARRRPDGGKWHASRRLEPRVLLRGRVRAAGRARMPVMTHGFLYGTATFEGIRAYWNEEQGQLYGLKLLEHFKRLWQSAKVLLMEPPHAAEQLVDLTVDLLRRNGFRQDAYVRPTLYKSTEAIGVRLHNLESSSSSSSRFRSASTSPSTAASAPRSSRGAATATCRSRRAPRSSART